MTMPRLTVLVVEDDEVVRLSLRFALETAGMAVREASDVAAALGDVRRQAPDIAVIDLHLPDGSGCDLASELRRTRSDLPLVFISTDPDASGQRPRLPSRATTLAKPFSASALLDAIGRVAAADGRHG